ncbi:MAG: nitroreductase family protein [Bacteroidales bacterium]|nr:nitroreductase family protein [Bacteroidales bacterium]
MELKEVIGKRRTIRDFQSKEISQDIIRYSIENAFKAPTYNHLRDWDFIIVNSLEAKLQLIESENLEKDIDIKELETLFENEDIVKKEMYLDAIPKQKRMILNAPIVVIVVFKPKIRVEEAKTVYDLNCLASVWCCIENFLLSLAEHDVYGVTFIPQNINKTKDKLKIPVDLEIAAIIPIGYKADDAKILKQKTINIPERIHFNKWD